ncbi:MAG: SDR family oxidoreductase [Planctomycetota bacterium]
MAKVDIKDKVALVTGANRGIGKEIVRALIGGGVKKVYGAVRKPASLDPLVDELGGKALVPVAFDLRDEQSARDAASVASDAQIIVANAGVMGNASVLSDDVFDTLRYELDANLFGFIRLVRAFVPTLERNGNGAIVQLNSAVSLKCFAPEFTTYCASKAASYSVTQALRMQLGERGISVFSVHPGPIATDMAHDSGFEDVAHPSHLVADAIVAALKSGSFHVWSDPTSKLIGDAYASFASSVIEAEWDLESPSGTTG